jgi:AraC-like DNA-binding protein
MEYQIINPPDSLRDLIRYFWTFEVRMVPRSGIKISTYVDDSSGIIFQQHSGSSAIKKDGQNIPRYLVYGQITDPSFNYSETGFSAVGVVFHPQALKQLFKVDAYYLRDRIFPMEEFEKKDCILEKLLNATDLSLKVSLLSQLILKRSKTAIDEDQLVKHSIRLIKSNQVHGVKELVKLSGISERQLERRFLCSVGVPPRHYFQIAKFETVVRTMREQTEGKLVDIASDLCFCDQPHFNKMIKKFSGLNPHMFQAYVKREFLNVLINEGS